MSIQATCDSCGMTYTLNDKYAGKLLPCKECGETFEVFDEEDYDPPPRQRRRPSQRSESPRAAAFPARRSARFRGKKRRSSGPNWPVIGISIGAGVVFVMLGVVLMFTVFGTTHDRLASDLVDNMENMVATLESVKDVASAKSAAPKIRKYGNRMVANFRKGSELEQSNPLTPAGKKALDEKYGERLRELGRRQLDELQRIRRNPAAAEAIKAALADVVREMNQARWENRVGSNMPPLPF